MQEASSLQGEFRDRLLSDTASDACSGKAGARYDFLDHSDLAKTLVLTLGKAGVVGVYPRDGDFAKFSDTNTVSGAGVEVLFVKSGTQGRLSFSSLPPGECSGWILSIVSGCCQVNSDRTSPAPPMARDGSWPG